MSIDDKLPKESGNVTAYTTSDMYRKLIDSYKRELTNKNTRKNDELRKKIELFERRYEVLRKRDE